MGLSAAPKWPKEGEKKNKATKKKWILFLYDLCALAHSGAHVMAAVANMLKLAGGPGGGRAATGLQDSLRWEEAEPRNPRTGFWTDDNLV